jgi:MFS family permease
VSTLGIGLLPDYSQIGVWAPTLLILMRLLQGFALGGEWAGAVLMSVEHAPPERRGYFGSIVGMGLPIGLVLSNFVFLVASVAADPAAFAAWGWRIPFLASAILVIIGLFIRVRLDESPEFTALQRSGRAARMPVLELLRTDAATVLLAAGTYTGESTSGYIVLVYYVSYATGVLKMPLPTVLGLVLVTASVFAVSVPMWARWSDRIGRPRVMMWGTGALIVWSAVFFPLLDTKSVPLMGLALGVMLVVQGIYIGTQPAFFAELFPTSIRYSGASLSNTLGTILGGAPAPFVAAPRTFVWDSMADLAGVETTTARVRVTPVISGVPGTPGIATGVWIDDSASLGARTDLLTGGLGAAGVAIADLDGDGDADLAVVDEATNDVAVLRRDT